MRFGKSVLRNRQFLGLRCRLVRPIAIIPLAPPRHLDDLGRVRLDAEMEWYELPIVVVWPDDPVVLAFRVDFIQRDEHLQSKRCAAPTWRW
jgi:hypothetical protein